MLGWLHEVCEAGALRLHTMAAPNHAHKPILLGELHHKVLIIKAIITVGMVRSGLRTHEFAVVGTRPSVATASLQGVKVLHACDKRQMTLKEQGRTAVATVSIPATAC